MKTSLQILHWEHDPLDAKLIGSILESEGFKCEVKLVETKNDFLSALKAKKYDLILADYSLPTFDGLTALKLTRKLNPDIPFIFVSGTLGEDAAIEGLTQGATDYVLKQKLSRLGPSIKRALREAEAQQKRTQAEAALLEIAERMRSGKGLAQIRDVL